MRTEDKNSSTKLDTLFHHLEVIMNAALQNRGAVLKYTQGKDRQTSRVQTERARGGEGRSCCQLGSLRCSSSDEKIHCCCSHLIRSNIVAVLI